MMASNPSGRPSFRDNVRGLREHQIEMPTGLELRDGWLTQYGTDYFRSEPRFEQEFDISVLKGKLTLQQTTYALLGRKPASHHSHRHFDVTRLVAADYRCMHTSRPRNPEHASILAGCTDDDIEAHRAWWADPSRARLDSLAESGV